MNTEQAIFTDWEVRGDKLVQTEFLHGNQTSLRGIILRDFEFGATLRLASTEHRAHPSYGIVAQYNEAEHLMIHFIQINDQWSLVVESVDVHPAINRVLPLPATFNPTTWHRLNLIQHHSLTHILLDDEVVLQIVSTTSTTQPGLTVQDATIECAHIWQVGLA